MLDNAQQYYLNEIKRHFREIKILLNRIEGREYTSDSVETLEMTVRTTNALVSVGILTIDQLLSCTEVDLLKIYGLGRKSLREVKEVLAVRDLYLRRSNVPKD